jgi:hypothetical protein
MKSTKIVTTFRTRDFTSRLGVLLAVGFTLGVAGSSHAGGWIQDGTDEISTTGTVPDAQNNGGWADHNVALYSQVLWTKAWSAAPTNTSQNTSSSASLRREVTRKFKWTGFGSAPSLSVTMGYSGSGSCTSKAGTPYNPGMNSSSSNTSFNGEYVAGDSCQSEYGYPSPRLSYSFNGNVTKTTQVNSSGGIIISWASYAGSSGNRFPSAYNIWDYNTTAQASAVVNYTGL